MNETYRIGEEYRQIILLAIANLAHERPGWMWTLGELADVFRGRDLFDQFRELATYGPLAGVGAIEGAREEHIAAYHLGAFVSALKAESRDLDALLEASGKFIANDPKALARLARLLMPAPAAGG